jgi:hypothetical protein
LLEREFEEAKAKMEFVMQGEIAIRAVVIGEETLFVKEVPTTTKGESHYNKECELNNRANANRSAIRDKTRSDAQTFEDDIDCILAEKQGDGRTFYLIYRIVIVNINLHKS